MTTRAEIEARTAARLEDARWMAETGECLDGAACRLGIPTKSLVGFLERNDRAILKTLVANQPLTDYELEDRRNIGADR